jgi:hypothetical protein
MANANGEKRTGPYYVGTSIATNGAGGLAPDITFEPLATTPGEHRVLGVYASDDDAATAVGRRMSGTTAPAALGGAPRPYNQAAGEAASLQVVQGFKMRKGQDVNVTHVAQRFFLNLLKHKQMCEAQPVVNCTTVARPANPTDTASKYNFHNALVVHKSAIDSGTHVILGILAGEEDYVPALVWLMGNGPATTTYDYGGGRTSHLLRATPAPLTYSFVLEENANLVAVNLFDDLAVAGIPAGPLAGPSPFLAIPDNHLLKASSIFSRNCRVASHLESGFIISAGCAFAEMCNGVTSRPGASRDQTAYNYLFQAGDVVIPAGSTVCSIFNTLTVASIESTEAVRMGERVATLIMSGIYHVRSFMEHVIYAFQFGCRGIGATKPSFYPSHVWDDLVVAGSPILRLGASVVTAYNQLHESEGAAAAPSMFMSNLSCYLLYKAVLPTSFMYTGIGPKQVDDVQPNVIGWQANIIGSCYKSVGGFQLYDVMLGGRATGMPGFESGLAANLAVIRTTSARGGYDVMDSKSFASYDSKTQQINMGNGCWMAGHAAMGIHFDGVGAANWNVGVLLPEEGVDNTVSNNSGTNGEYQLFDMDAHWAVSTAVGLTAPAANNAPNMLLTPLFADHCAVHNSNIVLNLPDTFQALETSQKMRALAVGYLIASMDGHTNSNQGFGGGKRQKTGQ